MAMVALILPMVQRNDVIGFVVLGDKPGAAGYRPDEIEILGWAVHQIGLDLHALRVEQLEQSVAAQGQENATLKTEVATLKAVLAMR